MRHGACLPFVFWGGGGPGGWPKLGDLNARLALGLLTAFPLDGLLFLGLAIQNMLIHICAKHEHGEEDEAKNRGTRGDMRTFGLRGLWTWPRTAAPPSVVRRGAHAIRGLFVIRRVAKERAGCALAVARVGVVAGVPIRGGCVVAGAPTAGGCALAGSLARALMGRMGSLLRRSSLGCIVQPPGPYGPCVPRRVAGSATGIVPARGVRTLSGRREPDVAGIIWANRFHIPLRTTQLRSTARA